MDVGAQSHVFRERAMTRKRRESITKPQGDDGGQRKSQDSDFRLGPGRTSVGRSAGPGNKTQIGTPFLDWKEC